MTKTERQLENDLRSMRQLCGFQLEKIQRLKAEIAKLKKRLKTA